MRDVPAAGLAQALGAENGGLVSLVGGGGKTTALYRLLREWSAAGLRALAATTTRIAVPGQGEPELRTADTWRALAEAVRRGSGRDLVLGRRVLPGGKVEGIPPEWCDRLLSEGIADALAVEADGAARLPVKAPAEWEPVVPPGTSVFAAVLGLSCVGKPLDGAHVFRPERVAEAAGLRLGESLRPEALVRLLEAPSGLAKGLPPGAAAVALLNQADGPGELGAAQEIAAGLLGAGRVYGRVVAAALGTDRLVRAVWIP